MWRLLFLIFITPLSFNLFGQNDSLKVIELEDVVVTGNRLNSSFKESSRNISIVTESKIKTMPVQSIPEILTYVPGVDIRQRGPMGVQADIGIRGGSFEQTLILLNGIKLTDPQTGHHSLNLPMNFTDISQVEVLKGPGARVYGQNAFSGAVNFITKVPDQRQLGLRLYGGENGLYGGNIRFALPTGKLKQSISVSRDASDGYRHNTDFKITNVFYQNELSLGNGELEIMAGWVDRKFGANGFYASPDFTEQYEEVTTSMVSMGYSLTKGNFMLNPRVYWRRNRDNYLFVRSNPEIYENLHYTNVVAAEVNGSMNNSLGITGIGIEFRKEMINGDWVRGGTESKSNLDGFERGKTGLFLEHQFKINRFDITPGIYVSHYSDFGWNSFPGIDLGYSINSKLRLYGNAGKSYRIPTFYDMYYKSPVEKGNPDLVPEEAVSYEIGLRYLDPAFTFEVNYFYQDADKLIDWVRTPTSDSTFYWQAANFSNIKRNGIEISTSLNLNNIIGNQIFIKSLFLSYNQINSNLLEKEIESRYTLENLKHQLIIGINHKIVWNVYHEFKARMNQREGDVPYWVLDSRIYWNKEDKSSIFIEATNWGDTEYVEVMTPMPGRWFRAGITYNLSF